MRTVRSHPRRPCHPLATAAALAVLLTAPACATDQPESADGPGLVTTRSPLAPTETAAATSEPTPAEDTTDTATATATATKSPTAASAKEPLTVTIGATGDLLPHARVIENANINAGGGAGDYDFSPMFALVTDLISEPDLSLCHLETPLSADNTGLTQPRALTFTSPFQLADAVAQAGWQGCDFASNHTMDGGLDGLAETEEVVRVAGLGYAGPTAFEQRAGRAEVYEAGEAVVAHLAYTYTYPNDGSPTTTVPEEAPWLAGRLWPVVGAEGITTDARRARADGADFVVVSMHWGAEYVTEPTRDQRELAKAMLTSGDVDLVLGTHAHTIQPCEQVNGRYVFYGLGNFLSNQSPDTTGGELLPATQEGMVVHVTLTRTPDGEVTSVAAYQPTRVDLDGHVVRPVTRQSAPETYERTVSTLASLGPDVCDAEPLG